MLPVCLERCARFVRIAIIASVVICNNHALQKHDMKLILRKVMRHGLYEICFEWLHDNHNDDDEYEGVQLHCIVVHVWCFFGSVRQLGKSEMLL